MGDRDEGVTLEDPRQRALIACLELVVELLVDALADLGRGRLDVDARRDRAHDPQDHPEVLHVGPDRLGHPRVLDLDRHIAAVVQAGAVDLADRGRGDRLLVELGEQVHELVLELGLDHLAHVVEADVGSGVAQGAELALELVAVLLGDQPDVEEAQDLPELHRRALHRAERGDDLLGRLDVALLERGRLALRRTHDVRRLGGHLPRALARGKPADARRSRDPAGGHLVLSHRAALATRRRCRRRSPRATGSRPCGRRRSRDPTGPASPACPRR